jgi:hypothetical protein
LCDNESTENTEHFDMSRRVCVSVPHPPNNYTVDNFTTHSFDIAIEQPTPATEFNGYVVHVSTLDGTLAQNVSIDAAQTNWTRATISGLEAGTRYKVVVYTVSGGLYSAPLTDANSNATTGKMNGMLDFI